MTVLETLAGPHLAKLRVEDFLLLADAGAFAHYARTELIDGEIWAVNAIHSRHARMHAQFTGVLWVALKASGSSLLLYTGPSTALSDDSMPEPDIALADPNDAAVLPGSALRLAIEISDSTIEMDMGRKAALYARYGIPEYWVVDIEARVIHQMWAPADEGYAVRREVAFGERIAAETVAGLAVETGEIGG